MWVFVLGSGNSLVRTAGLAAITNISVACNYQSVTELVNSNADYFSFHVVRKIHRAEHNKSVLNVLAVVMNYSTIDVLESMADIVSGVSFLIILIILLPFRDLLEFYQTIFF